MNQGYYFSNTSNCYVCDQIEGRQANDLIAHMLPDEPYRRRVMLETQSFAVIPSLGPLANGHSLLCPKQHIRSFAAIGLDLFEEYKQIKYRIKLVLTELYGTGIHIFEHGMATKGSRIVCSVDHAHMHFVPLPSSDPFAISEAHGWIEFDGSLETLLKLAQDGEYVFYETPDGVYRLLTMPEGNIESQFMRKAIAEKMGHGERWNWREVPDARAADLTFRRFSETGLQ